MSEQPAIAVSDLRKQYRGRTVVDGISLRIQQGQIFGILGPNGAGKTTTVEMIAGLRKPDSGTVSVLGLDPRRDRQRLRQVLGVQLQSAYLHHALTVAELIDLFRSFYPRPLSNAEALSLVHLEQQRHVRFEKLSGGQQQRLSVALALVGRPSVVILDEITTGLDPGARRRIWATIESLRDSGVTVLMVSHAMDEIERLCDRVALLQDGRLLTVDTPQGVTDSAEAMNLEEAFVQLTGHDIHTEEEA